ncbi:hypothetical protein [Dactylosporangium cerinum]
MTAVTATISVTWGGPVAAGAARATGVGPADGGLGTAPCTVDAEPNGSRFASCGTSGGRIGPGQYLSACGDSNGGGTPSTARPPGTVSVPTW